MVIQDKAVTKSRIQGKKESIQAQTYMKHAPLLTNFFSITAQLRVHGIIAPHDTVRIDCASSTSTPFCFWWSNGWGLAKVHSYSYFLCVGIFRFSTKRRIASSRQIVHCMLYVCLLVLSGGWFFFWNKSDKRIKYKWPMYM